MMKTILKTTLIAGLSLLSLNSLANEALAKSKGCLGCHAIDKKVVGPAYKDVAQKYAGQNVVDQLSEKVMKGGGGVWGGMAMPPNAVTPEEAKKLVQWVLSQK
jgi:cytochrome c